MSVHARSRASAQDLMAHAFKDHGYDVDRFKLDPDLLKTHEGHSPIMVSTNAWASSAPHAHRTRRAGRSS